MKTFAFRILMLLAVALPTFTAGTLFIGTMSGCMTPIEKGENAALVNFERAQKVAVATLDEFVRFDHANAAVLPASVRVFANRVRTDAPPVIREVRRLTAAYKATPDIATKDNLEAALHRLESLAATARRYMTENQ